MHENVIWWRYYLTIPFALIVLVPMCGLVFLFRSIANAASMIAEHINDIGCNIVDKINNWSGWS